MKKRNMLFGYKVENGQKVISIEEKSISDKHIDTISLSKITLKNGDIFILNGGNANGN